MKLRELLKTYNADRYYHLTVFKGKNALVSDLEIEANVFSFIDEEILNMEVFDWGDKYYFNKDYMKLTVRVE